MRLVETIGHLDGIDPIRISGIVDRARCVAVRVIDRRDEKPISWAMSEKALADLRRIVEAAA